MIAAAVALGIAIPMLDLRHERRWAGIDSLSPGRLDGQSSKKSGAA
jgi:hypothetical protein